MNDNHESPHDPDRHGDGEDDGDGRRGADRHDGAPDPPDVPDAPEVPDGREMPGADVPGPARGRRSSAFRARVRRRLRLLRARARARARRRRRTGWRRLVPTWRMVLGGALLSVALACGAFAAGYLLVDIPEPKSVAAAEANTFLYSDGSLLARVGEVNRESIPLERVPVPVRQAVLAAEDRDFYSTPAVDPKAMIRAGWNMLRGGAPQSGSTITQQYVKNYYLDQSRTVDRKVREFFIALKLGHKVSKDDILEGYLNTSYFGRGAYGIQAAARAYYDKDADRLTTAEGAYLAALLNAPSAYDVHAHPEHRTQALARWNYVLDGMVASDWLSEEERRGMAFPEPRTPGASGPEADTSTGLGGQRGYLVETVTEHLTDAGLVDADRLEAGGLRITTTFDRNAQQALTEAVESELAARLSADREQDAAVRAGAASVETATGKVLALYGGTDFTEQFVNNATRRDYQAASTFKPFVYAAALEHASTDRSGEPIGPRSEYDGTSGREVLARDGRGTGWAPENAEGAQYGTMTVEGAMNQSVNAVFAQLGQDVGPDRVRDVVVRLGIPEDTPGLEEAQGSIALGTVTPSALDLAHAYATLAAHGLRHPLTLVTSVTSTGSGEEKFPLPPRRAERAIGRAAADGTTALLQRVVRHGTGMAAQAANRPAAGKTGTAEHDRAAWFAGYTPELATVVMLLGQDPATGAQMSLYGALGSDRVYGGDVPARIWARYTASALADRPVRDFDLDRTHEPGADLPDDYGTELETPPEPPGPADPTGPAEPAETAGTAGPVEPVEPAGPGDTEGPGAGAEEPGPGVEGAPEGMTGAPAPGGMDGAGAPPPLVLPPVPFPAPQLPF
ncbi:transglycosylase domain-containing protein [Streptomyces aidingensis]|uniref:Membrane carboxypeptidase (Penicillin-binding protein) n=1 Tax=Streptomyces aidingensis TaxID=910347 RepID=A0A1I1RP71_9ACTN|nr:transglycosylase domain-containing protein [Streptomyces aidingensis]SFD33353.1 Membrane carboxypeptidase (penicillin-binding protein) [Streptomyces aidingensis]